MTNTMPVPRWYVRYGADFQFRETHSTEFRAREAFERIAGTPELRGAALYGPDGECLDVHHNTAYTGSEGLNPPA